MEVKISLDVFGEIVELLVEEGDLVIVGQLLVKIDFDIYQLQVQCGVVMVNSVKVSQVNFCFQVEVVRVQVV